MAFAEIQPFLSDFQCLKGSPGHGRPGHEGPGHDLAPVMLQDQDKSFQRRIVCQACKELVTYDEARLAMNEKHNHTFFNPQGLVFRVACFQIAPGTMAVGQPSDDFTWFAGYRWQIALCNTCRRHLGWYFSGSGTFFGLIENRLVEIEEEE